MNDPVDELVGAAEEVVMSSIRFYLLTLMVPRIKAYNDVKQWHQGELAICAQGRLHGFQSHSR